MKVFKHTPLYRFLEYCNEEEILYPSVLDCGAGGKTPPLSLFASHDYKTYGIDLDEGQVMDAINYGLINQQPLNIITGDMTRLEFDDHTFDFVYSYNSIFHMEKASIEKSIVEMTRVLKPGGLMFVNFLSVDDFRCGQGPHLGNNTYEQMDDELVLHSYYDYDEADQYFEAFEFVTKERRIFERIYDGQRIKQGFIDYIVRKK